MQHLESADGAAASQHFTVLDCLHLIAKRCRLIAAVTVGTACLTAALSLALPNVYTAKAKLLPPTQQGGVLSAAMMQGALSALGSEMLGESKSAKLYAEMLKMEGLRDPIIDRFKLQQVYEVPFRQDVYPVLSKNVTVVAGKEGLITITVDDEDPQRAAGIANALVEELKKLTTTLSTTGAGNTSGFLNERLVQAKRDLTKAEDDLKAFQSRYKTVDVSQQAALSANAVAQLTAQLTAQEIQLSVLRRSYADSSQAVKELRESIGALRGKISGLQGQKGLSALPGLEQLPERGQEYLRLMRNFKTAESVYELLVKQHEVSKLNAENDVSTIQVVQQARAPERKSKPTRSVMVLASCVVGFLVAVGMSFALEAFARLPEGEKARWRELCRRG